MTVAETTRTTEFVALGHAGSEHYAGLETFPNPGVTRVELASDELTAVCPITGQPDLYRSDRVRARRALPRVEVAEALPERVSQRGRFAEALAVRIRDDVAAALELPAARVRVRLVQKARGGITITAEA